LSQARPGAADGYAVTKSPSAVSTARALGRITRRGRNTGPQPYDFRRPIKLSREHVRTLQIAFETYARSCATLLTTRLRTVSHVTLLAIEQLTYDEYVGTLTSPTVVATVTAEPLPGAMLVELSLPTAMASIDHLLGGPGGTQPERPLTDLEVPLLRGLLDRMLGELRYGFEALIELDPKLGNIEYNPQFIRVLGPSDAVVVASFEMKIGAEECVASICIPFASIFPVLQTDDDVELSASERAARRTAHQHLSASISMAPIDVAVRFQPIRMRTADIVGLQPGDVVPLTHSVARPLAITVNDATLAHAVPGNQGSRLACLVVPASKEDLRS
jgi:flagellar motor switch protein FliM